jgi:hypothetical protein
VIADSVGRGVQVRGPSSGQTGRSELGAACCAETVETAETAAALVIMRAMSAERTRRERSVTMEVPGAELQQNASADASKRAGAVSVIVTR